MTTIAYNYKDKEIAVDGRVTSDNLIIRDDDVKFTRKDGQLFVWTSSGDDGRRLVDVYFGEKPIKEDYSATVMFTYNKSVFLMTYSNGALNQWEVKENTTIGSGGVYALAAMDFGCNARGAVKYASTRDNCTGGKIRVLKVK